MKDRGRSVGDGARLADDTAGSHDEERVAMLCVMYLNVMDMTAQRQRG